MSVDYGTVVAVKVTDEPRYGRTASGYGRKVPTRYKVRLQDDLLWRRVYCAIFSNSGSLYVQVKGKDVYLHSTDIEVLLEGASA